MIKKALFIFSALALFSLPAQLSAATGYVEISWGDFLAGNSIGSEPPNYLLTIDSTWHVIPIHFPVKTGTVKALRMRAKDENASYEIKLKLYRVKHTGGGKDLVYLAKSGVAFSSSALSTFTVNTLSTPNTDAIDNSQYSWVIFLFSDCPSASSLEKFYSARIEYTY